MNMLSNLTSSSVPFTFDNCLSLVQRTTQQTKAPSQLILQKGLMALEGRQNNVLYQIIEIRAGIRISDLG